MAETTPVSRRRVLQGAGVAGLSSVAGLAGLAAFGPATALAKSEGDDEDSIVGAWRGQISANGLPTFGSLTSFAQGGTLVASASVDLSPPFLSTPGYGAWRRTADNRYAVRFEFFTFAAGGAPSGSGEIVATVTVDDNRQHGSFTLKIFDVSGSLLLTTTGTLQARRIQA
jgi:hypothetical protein